MGKTEKKYLAALWKKLNDEGRSVYRIESHYAIHALKSELLYEIQGDGYFNKVLKSQHRDSITDAFKNESEFSAAMSSQSKWKIHGFEEMERFAIDFFTKIRKSEATAYFRIVSKTFPFFRTDVVKTAKKFFDNLDETSFCEWWNSIPSSAARMSLNVNQPEKIANFLDEALPLEKSDELILSFISKRSKEINRSKSLSIFIRDFVASRFRRNHPLISEYAESVEAIRLWNEARLRPSFIEPLQEGLAFRVDIDIDKLNAFASVPGMGVESCKQWLSLLLNRAFDHSDSVEGIDLLFGRKGSESRNVASAFVSKSSDDGIDRKAFVSVIERFFNDLSNHSGAGFLHASDRSELVERWLAADSLRRLLHKRESESSSSKGKI